MTQLISTAIQIGDRVRNVDHADFLEQVGKVVDLSMDQFGVMVEFIAENGIRYGAYDDQLEWVD
jgi:hypothetical protein